MVTAYEFHNPENVGVVLSDRKCGYAPQPYMACNYAYQTQEIPKSYHNINIRSMAHAIVPHKSRPPTQTDIILPRFLRLCSLFIESRVPEIALYTRTIAVTEVPAQKKSTNCMTNWLAEVHFKLKTQWLACKCVCPTNLSAFTESAFGTSKV